MALTPGSRFGAYQVLGAIDSGGMGDVFRARDSKLGREVALKVLPQLVAADPERIRRFAREARVLASLNHPNIATIHDHQSVDGIHALVMELVDGPTLADRIRDAPIPLREALDIGAQIAEALEVAHNSGVVHRDLKPANVKVRPDGKVKVLDFGLAKMLEPTEGAAPTQSPTVTGPATELGVFLGTPAYASPEQARGLAVDKRADVWAFGCVLFEMLTRKRAFSGATVGATLASVIADEPPWSRLPPETPDAVRRLLRRCLEKDPRARQRDLGDAQIDLREALARRGSIPRRRSRQNGGVASVPHSRWPPRSSQPRP